MEKGFYHPSIGYWQTLSEPTAEIRQGYPSGTREITVKPDNGYEFDGEQWVAPSETWITQSLAMQVRATRNYKLTTEVDPIVSNILRWNDLTEEKKQAWANYRRDLLDISEQAGFPNVINWPTKPDLL
jgi:hypothetical protein